MSKSVGSGRVLAQSVSALAKAIREAGNGAPKTSTVRDALITILMADQRLNSDGTTGETTARLRASFDPACRDMLYDLIPHDPDSNKSGSAKSRLCDIVLRLLKIPLPILLASARAAVEDKASAVSAVGRQPSIELQLPSDAAYHRAVHARDLGRLSHLQEEDLAAVRQAISTTPHPHHPHHYMIRLWVTTSTLSRSTSSGWTRTA